MQQNNYKEAEDAYRRALSIAPDNNKMCNLGICLMKQGRIIEAKQTLRRVKPAVSDGPRGMDSHLKAYERAQQMLADLESELMQKAGDSVSEQSRLFNTFLGSSSLWQPQPCRETYSYQPNTKIPDEFPDENTNSNILHSNNNQNFPPKPNNNHNNNNGVCPMGNSWNIDAPPFYSSKLVKEPSEGNQLHETLKRTRSGNVASFGKEICSTILTSAKNGSNQERENKMLRRSLEEPLNKLAEFLPDDKDFEDAIISAVLNTIHAENSAAEVKKISQKFEVKKAVAVDKRLKVFQDITLSLSPRA